MGCTQSAASPVIATAVPYYSSVAAPCSKTTTPYDAVLHAVQTGNLNKLRKILGRPTPPPLTVEDLETLCVVAAKKGHVLCLEQLANFADRINVDVKMVAAYYAANVHNQLECFDYIVDRMPDEFRPTIAVYQAPALW